ncbi:hypothetical protein AN958_10197 [Leucoagaricus sp. SymC.cos]|nr:hypothetical protein AN958_10197 [Leucoagaricus sp. SymC.cos]
MNWFSVAARSSLSRVSCIGFRALSISDSTCIGTMVVRDCAITSMVPRCCTTLFLKTALRQLQTTYTRRPTCFPPPGLSRSFVESLMTVVPRLYRALAKPSSSSSKSP